MFSLCWHNRELLKKNFVELFIKGEKDNG
jgi:hypothetical protein